MRKIFYILIILPFSLYSQTQIGDTIAIDSWEIETSYDGKTIAILEDSLFAINVRTYVYRNSTWATNPNNDLYFNDLGSKDKSLKMSKDGNFLAVGSSNRGFNPPDPNLRGIGFVRIFENVNDQWVKVGADLSTGNLIDGFGDGSRGNGIDFSSNGSIIAIGAHTYHGSGAWGSDSGLVRVFQNINGNWQQMGADIIGEVDSNTGIAVSLSDDGLTMAVGASQYQNHTGRAKVYSFQSNNWTQIGSAIDGDAPNNLFGLTLSLSADGNRLAVGAANALGNHLYGYVRVYQNINNSWIQIGNTLNEDASDFRFGLRTSLSSDGSVLAVKADSKAKVYQIANDSISLLYEINSYSSNMALSKDGSRLIVEPNGVVVFDISDTTTSIIEHKEAAQSFFPNPASDQINILLKENDSFKRANIYTIEGRFILSSKSKSIDISTLVKGMYIVEIETLSGKSLQKLLAE